MPFSSILGKSLTLLTVNRLHARHALTQVVDIGPGHGTYGRLLRPILPEARYVAVEVWAPYIKEFGLREVYDDIHVADARVFDYSHLARGGVAVLGDVLEHMTQAEAQAVVLALLARCDAVILSIPIGIWPQGEYLGNPWEAHVASYGPGHVRLVFPYVNAEMTFNTGENAGIGVFVLSQRLPLHDTIVACFTEAADILQANTNLFYCGLEEMADLRNPENVGRIHNAIAPFLV